MKNAYIKIASCNVATAPHMSLVFNLKMNEKIKQIYKDKTYFYSKEIISIIEKFDYIEMLIGASSHSPSEGYHCEEILKEYLRKNIPKRFSVDSGFIKCSPIPFNNGSILQSSKQIDILIHDESNFSPIYRTGDLVIVTPEAVAGIIEVKKTLDSTSLKDALINIAIAELTLQERLFTSDVVFSGILSFSTRRLSIKSKTLTNKFNEIRQQQWKLPNSIISFRDFYIDIEWNGQIPAYKTKGYNAIFDDEDAFNLSLMYMMYKFYNLQRLEIKSRFLSSLINNPVWEKKIN